MLCGIFPLLANVPAWPCKAETAKSHLSVSVPDVTFRNGGSRVIYSISLHDSCAVIRMFSAVLLSHTTSSALTAGMGWDGLAAKGECF